LCYTGIDVEQDHGFGGGISHILGCSREPFRAILHSLERVERKSMSDRLLREQNLLRDVSEKYSSRGATIREK